MASLWTEEEYAITNALYERALSDRASGVAIKRADLIRKCQTQTGRTKDGSVLMHLGNLTSARAALGLAVLPEIGPLENFPKKLFRFLEKQQDP